jgi:hypothetical protein
MWAIYNLLGKIAGRLFFDGVLNMPRLTRLDAVDGFHEAGSISDTYRKERLGELAELARLKEYKAKIEFEANAPIRKALEESRIALEAERAVRKAAYEEELRNPQFKKIAAPDSDKWPDYSDRGNSYLGFKRTLSGEKRSEACNSCGKPITYCNC